MAIDQIDNLNIAITTTTFNGIIEIGRVAFLSKDFEECKGMLVVIGTSARTITLESIPKFIYIKNDDTVHDLLIDSASTFDSFPQRIIPGGSCCMSPEGNTFYMKASAGTCNIWMMTDSVFTVA